MKVALFALPSAEGGDILELLADNIIYSLNMLGINCTGKKNEKIRHYNSPGFR